MAHTIISADSHITEPPDTYSKHIDPAFRDRAPHLVRADNGGDVFMIPGMPTPIPMGLVAAAGKRPEDISLVGRFEDWHRGGWDPHARLADQDRDGVNAEILYPTIGMPLCNHEDLDYKKACFDAYNLWIAEYCSAHPDRLLGIGQTAMRTPQDGVADLRRIKDLGLKGVMLPGQPGQADYDSEIYGEFWEAAIDLALPLSFHILTTRNPRGVRGPVLNHAVTIIRANQDIIAMLVYGGVFDRHPRLKIVCVEADAGWLPHYMYRMDHYYTRHRHSLHGKELQKLPSEYLRENIYLTFQDDWVAFRMLDMVNPHRLMWANDFPHSDSTWPWSQDVLKEHAARLTEEQRRLILHDNVAELYGLNG
jgi:predicted TIM-barrel fold metal-dependent hydrolase